LRLRADLRTPHPASSPVSRGHWTRVRGLIAAVGFRRHQLDPNARTTGAKNDAALAAYVAGLSATDANSRRRIVRPALSQPIRIWCAYLALIEYSQARGDRPMPSGFWPRPALAGGDWPQSTATRLDVATAQLSGNSAALSQSLAALSRLTPADANLLRTLAGAELQGRRYGTAIEYYKKALAAQPDDSTVLNVLGYTQAYAGDLDGAVKRFVAVPACSPHGGRIDRFVGTVHFYLGHFSEAEKSTGRSIPKIPPFSTERQLIKAATRQSDDG